ncbi:inositol monophosphatase family protein [Natronoarchaeum sp. GCM10025703]|uniref:inositol monophosphatase family protein n=1 Tax=unclassified Natronoarchaeum TaxID=2620183 RepID=UPI00360D6EF6
MSERVDIGAVATAAAAAGAQVAAAGFEADLDVDIKGNGEGPVGPADVVTETDREAQRHVVEVLTDRDPAATIVGEENDAVKTVPSTGRAWVIDPIDGTFNFVRGLHYWTTSVAATVDGEPVAACSVLPAIGTTYHAEETGAHRDDEPITVSEQSDERSATVAPIIPPSYGERETYVEGLGAVFERFGTTLRLCSAQATFALIADGSLDAAVTPQRPNPWDSLAGAHLVRQAGGVVTDLDGDRWTADSDSMVVSNGAVHEQLLDAAQGLR